MVIDVEYIIHQVQYGGYHHHSHELLEPIAPRYQFVEILLHKPPDIEVEKNTFAEMNRKTVLGFH